MLTPQKLVNFGFELGQETFPAGLVARADFQTAERAMNELKVGLVHRPFFFRSDGDAVGSVVGIVDAPVSGTRDALALEPHAQGTANALAR